MLKRENGITTATLIFIIVVLFILLGIAISLVVKDNGMLTETRIAIASDDETRVKEEIRTAYVSTQYQYWVEWENDSNINKEEFFMENDRLEENIKKVAGKNAEVKVTRSEEFDVNYKFIDTNESFKFKIDSNGNVFNPTKKNRNI